MAQIETDENGHGIVVMSEYGGLGTYEITDMPFGTYRIYEERAPYNYERNSAVAQLVINEEGEFLSVDGKEVSTSTELEISWETWDKVISGKIDLSIYKQDVETGDKSQGDAVLSGAEFTVNYYRNFIIPWTSFQRSRIRAGRLRRMTAVSAALRMWFCRREQSRFRRQKPQKGTRL